MASGALPLSLHHRVVAGDRRLALTGAACFLFLAPEDLHYRACLDSTEGSPLSSIDRQIEVVQRPALRDVAHEINVPVTSVRNLKSASLDHESVTFNDTKQHTAAIALAPDFSSFLSHGSNSILFDRVRHAVLVGGLVESGGLRLRPQRRERGRPRNPEGVTT